MGSSTLPLGPIPQFQQPRGIAVCTVGLMEFLDRGVALLDFPLQPSLNRCVRAEMFVALSTGSAADPVQRHKFLEL